MSRDTFERRLFELLRRVSIAGFLVITVFPLLYMITLSLKPIASLLRNPMNPLPSRSELSWENYQAVLSPLGDGGFGFPVFIRNSAVLSLATVATVLALATLGAYAAARLRFRGRRAVNAIIIIVYMFPPILLAVPMFVFFSGVGLRPSMVAVWIIYVAITLPLGLFLLRNYFEAMPNELDDAARVDGASRLQVIRFVTVPLARPAIAAVGLYVFISTWDEFLFALLILADSRDLWTATLGIQSFKVLESSPEAVLLAACVVITVPVVIAFAVAQRLLVEGLTSGGVKE